MAELEAIVETLKRQRQDLEEAMEGTAARRGEATELATKIEELRRRVADTRRRFQASVSESDPKSGQ